jgi:hypothetical protein
MKQGVIVALVWAFTTPACWAEMQTTTAPNSNTTQAVSASARLDFNLSIGKFLFFRVGSGTFPSTSSTVDTVTFNAAPSIPASPGNGNSQSISWNGSAPAFTANNATLPVEVRSNAGQISIRATASTPLSSGTVTLPLSDIKITSSDSNLPAPLVPASGTGAAVNVTGTSFANLITERNANWTFSYLPSAPPTAGVYQGVITFTASSP